ncbi:ribonuclease domain-containing protein [Pseudescherichia vulneris]|uniref:ribonuclease domain-containing protein n=1 Tax=Pseudescherichia vulneris TaxID=566 RepID=UPI0028D4306A|nr:ribonuclease domain-containing protein [Pseudescherichia vulneris]
MNNRCFNILPGALLCAMLAGASAQAVAKPTCEQSIGDINNFLKEKGEPTIQSVPALAATLRYLNEKGTLPMKYITRQQAKDQGWSGNDSDSLWGLNKPNGKYIGGEVYTGRKPTEGDTWRSADIDVVSGYRGEKRMLYTNNSNQEKYISPDNYRHLVRLSPCE